MLNGDRQFRERSNKDKYFRQRVTRLGERLMKMKMSKALPSGDRHPYRDPAQRGRTARGQWERVLTVGETEKNIRKHRPL